MEEDIKDVNVESSSLEEPSNNVYGNGHTSLYADVIDSIKKHRKPYIDASAGRNAVEIVLAIYKSSSLGHVVKLPITKCVTTDFVGMF